jgi:hypothetical protein
MGVWHCLDALKSLSTIPQDNYDQAMDILKSGLGFNQTGVAAGR